MGKILKFSNENLGRLKVFIDGGRPYFLAEDIAKILGYAHGRSLSRRYVSRENKFIKMFNSGKGARNRMFLNVDGVCEVLHSVKTLTSDDFEYWLSNEVLPELYRQLDNGKTEGKHFVKNSHNRDKKSFLYKLLKNILN